MDVQSAFERDPDLDPIKPPAGAEPIPTSPSGPRRPVIAPAEPRRWSTVIALDFPVLVDGVRLDAITARMATGADISELMIEDDDETSLNLRVRARICGVHPDVLTGLAATDAEKVTAACRPFLPAGLLALEEIVLADLAGIVAEADPASAPSR